MIDGIVIAVPDNPRQLTSSKGMGDRQPHDVLLDVSGQESSDGGLPPRMGQGAPIDQAQEACPPKAPQITPQPPVVHPGLLALLTRDRSPFSTGRMAS